MTAQPQIALVGAQSWAIIGAYFTSTGLLALWLLPQVDCPVLDTSLIEQCQVQRIIQSYIRNPTGIEDVEALIEALLQCGARLINPLSTTSYPIDITSVKQEAYQ